MRETSILIVNTKVVVIDGFVAVRQMVSLVLSQSPGFLVVGEAASGLDALQMVGSLEPQMVILDLVLPEMSGLELLKSLRRSHRRIRTLVFSGTENVELAAAALRELPHGYVHKRDSLSAFRTGIQAVSAGGTYFTPFATDLLESRVLLPVSRKDCLSARERTVLQMVAEGANSKEIAGRLNLSPKTVEHYRSKVLQKLNLRTGTALARYAIGQGLIEAL